MEIFFRLYQVSTPAVVRIIIDRILNGHLEQPFRTLNTNRQTKTVDTSKCFGQDYLVSAINACSVKLILFSKFFYQVKSFYMIRSICLVIVTYREDFYDFHVVSVFRAM